MEPFGFKMISDSDLDAIKKLRSIIEVYEGALEKIGEEPKYPYDNDAHCFMNIAQDALAQAKKIEGEK